MHRVHYMSEQDSWETPGELFRRLDTEFRFTLDVCALPHNAKCRRYFTPDDDGLSKAWRGVCWMNPPYGRDIGKWMKKASESAGPDCTVVCLVPARTDTEWWHTYALRGDIRYIRGRVKFAGAQTGAPFPSAIVIFQDRWWERRQRTA